MTSDERPRLPRPSARRPDLHLGVSGEAAMTIRTLAATAARHLARAADHFLATHVDARVCQLSNDLGDADD